jgi:UDP-perosamine 4-acetyltransferase
MSLATESIEPVVVFGAGGHAKVVIETCSGTRYRPVVCLGESRWSRLVGVPVEPEAQAAKWRAQGIRFAFVAIGSNVVRDRVATKSLDLGFDLITVVSQHAYVSPTATLGIGTVVMAGAVVQVEARVGDLGIVNTGASVDHECVLGRAVHVAPHATLCGNVTAGDRAWIGAGSTVIEGIQIAEDVFIAAGAAVVNHVNQAGTRYGGVPAKALS